MNLGLKLEDVRDEVLNLLGHGMESAEAGSEERGGNPTAPPGQKSAVAARHRRWTVLGATSQN